MSSMSSLFQAGEELRVSYVRVDRPLAHRQAQLCRSEQRFLQAKHVARRGLWLPVRLSSLCCLALLNALDWVVPPGA